MKSLKHYLNGLRLKGARLRDAFYTALAMVLVALPSEAFAQGEGEKVLNEANTALKDVASTLVQLLKTVMGLGALVVLVIVIFKVFKGDREAAEKLAWWVAGLTLGFVLIQVVQTAVGL